MFVAASERTLRYQDIAALHEGDYFLDGKLYDAQGNEVPLAGDDAMARRRDGGGTAEASGAEPAPR
ncbi:hypothetical protein P4123_04235 [Pseudomonas aeruginosa]|nr:hypothetical protein [Pseudomonas aeruginosa]